MSRKSLLVIAALGIPLLFLAGYRHEKTSSGSQNFTRYVAFRTIEHWTFFGVELYAIDTLGVYDQAIPSEPGSLVTRTLSLERGLPDPIGEPLIQTRIFGVYAIKRRPV